MVVRPHQTLLLDIGVKSSVHEGVFRLTRGGAVEDIRRQAPGEPIE